jgi:hypothetical protein
MDWELIGWIIMFILGVLSLIIGDIMPTLVKRAGFKRRLRGESSDAEKRSRSPDDFHEEKIVESYKRTRMFGLSFYERIEGKKESRTAMRPSKEDQIATKANWSDDGG